VETVTECPLLVATKNLIQYGKLLIQARLGELIPPKTRQEAGAMKGKKGSSPPELPFAKETLAIYRTVAKHKPELESSHSPWLRLGGIGSRLVP